MGRRYIRSFDRLASPDTGLGQSSENAAGGSVDGYSQVVASLRLHPHLSNPGFFCVINIPAGTLGILKPEMNHEKIPHIGRNTLRAYTIRVR